QINRIRFMELRASRAGKGDPENLVDRVSVQIPPDVANKFLLLKQGDGPFRGEDARKRFLSMTAAQKLAVMAYWLHDTHEEFEFADAVQIKTDPEVIVRFRNRIQPTLLAKCASSNCHGSSDVTKTKLRLYDDPKNREVTTYANLVTLREWLVDGRPVID